MSSMPPVRVTVALIVRVVAELWEVEPHALLSTQRPRQLSNARHALYLLACEQTLMTTAAIARQLGDRDHTTIAHGRDKAYRLIETDPQFRARVAEARERIPKLAATCEGARYRDADPVAAAKKIMRNPNRECLLASADAIVAMADRVLAQEEIAATAYRLLITIDAIETLGGDEAQQAEIAALADSARALTDTLASALAALGYAVEEETDGTTEDEDAGTELAGAAE